MTKIHAYLNFNGQCEEAFKFYERVFNKPNTGLHRFGDLPAEPGMPPLSEDDKAKVMHTSIQINDHTMLMGSDCIETFGQKATAGTSAYYMLDTDTAEEARSLYSSLTEDAQNIEMELGEQPWAELYASFTDKYGIAWMVHYEGSKAQSFQ